MRSAAEAAARRLGIEPPLGSLSPAQLRTLAHELQAEHRTLGGGLALSDLELRPRRELEEHIAALRTANRRLKADSAGQRAARRRAAA